MHHIAIGGPYYVSGDVTHSRDLAHRTVADLEVTRMVYGQFPSAAGQQQLDVGASAAGSGWLLSVPPQQAAAVASWP